MRKTFRTWLMGHLNEDTPLGDLARDAKADSGWTGNGSTTLYRAMLDGGACYEAMQTLQEAKRQYRRERAV
jgi:hypothetical protein